VTNPELKPTTDPKSKLIVQVFFLPHFVIPNSRSGFDIIELRDITTFAEFESAILDDQNIFGNILLTVWSKNQRGERAITERVQTSFRGASVMRSMLPTWSFVEGSAFTQKNAAP